MVYRPSPHRYERARFYQRCGRSGLVLPRLSLGLWHNFGELDEPSSQRALILRAFDLGITHFDLANNYGPPPGAAETNFGRIFRDDLRQYRDEILVSTKAGFEMWAGPYGEWGSRKHLLSSLDQSLRRLGLDYVDIFYHHRPDPDTPLEESLGALADAVRSGKALYAGISNYSREQTAAAVKILRELSTPCLIHQVRYHMFDRSPEQEGLFDTLLHEGVGCIVFSPLGQGVLTSRYLKGLPPDSRAVRDPRFLRPGDITASRLQPVQALESLARRRGQSIAQMALAWVLRQPAVTSAVIGASKIEQLEENIRAIDGLEFDADEIDEIENTLGTRPQE